MLENLKQFEIAKEQLVTVFGGIDGGGGSTGTGDGDLFDGGGGTGSNGDGDFYCDETVQIC